MRSTVSIILIFFNFASFGQKVNVHDLPIPKSLEECFYQLDKSMEANEIIQVKKLPEDSIVRNPSFRDGADFFHAWNLYEGSQLTKYFEKKGLFGSREIYETILISYHRYLNKEEIDLGNQIFAHKAKQKKAQEKYLVRIKQDSINGTYIPKDLSDCFVELDKILSKNDREGIKSLASANEVSKYHLSVGMRLRNSWHLYDGSRLQKYFIDKKVYEPEKMSSLILRYYYDWLNNNNNSWKKWMR